MAFRLFRQITKGARSYSSTSKWRHKIYSWWTALGDSSCIALFFFWKIDWQCITKNVVSTHGLLINSPGWAVHSMQVPVLGKGFILHLGCLIRPDTVSDFKLSTMELWRLRDNVSWSLVPRPESWILLGMQGLRICFRLLNLNPWTLGCKMCFNEPPHLGICQWMGGSF